jgi:hypothetical protein
MFYASHNVDAYKRQLDAVLNTDPNKGQLEADYQASLEEIKMEVLAGNPLPTEGDFYMFRRPADGGLVWAVRKAETLPARLADMATIEAARVELPPFTTAAATWSKWHRALKMAGLVTQRPVECLRKNGQL